MALHEETTRQYSHEEEEEEYDEAMMTMMMTIMVTMMTMVMTMMTNMVNIGELYDWYDHCPARADNRSLEWEGRIMWRQRGGWLLCC